VNVSRYRLIAIICLVFLLGAAAIAHTQLWKNRVKDEDIYYNWLEGERIVNGENPYARILGGDMLNNYKYATYFPAFYELAAAMHWAGLSDFSEWLSVWREIALFFSLAIAAQLFFMLYPQGGLLAACFAAAFWLFNRWTLSITAIAHIDFVPIFFLLLSLSLFHRRRSASFLLFSLSLAFKQIAVFLFPLYLIWTWHFATERKLKQTLAAGLLIASVPLLTSLPFLAWNAEGFIRSLLFSFTRQPMSHFAAPSLDSYMQWLGVAAKLPMLGVLLAVYLLAWHRKVGMYTASLLAMATFIDFNSVLFKQYVAWIVPLFPLILLDFWEGTDKKLTVE
jgi:hypothetical protein